MSPVKGPIKVLLVDEDRDYLNLTKRILDRVPEFSVETTPSPSEALMIIDDSLVDAVVSDYQMPEMSGLELLREVRGRHGDLPFIILTGRSREEVAIEALNLGADFYLQKGLDPLQVTELTNMIRQTVKRRWAEKALRDSDALHRLILDSSPVAISVNVEGKIVYANRKRAELTGNASPEELNGQDSMLAVHPDDLEAMLSRQGARRRGERTEPNFSFRAVTKQGETRYVETSSAELRWGGMPALLFFSRDVTAERIAQRQVLESRERLQALHGQAAVINQQESHDGVVKAVYEACAMCLGYQVIDIIKVEDGLLRGVYPVKGDPGAPFTGPGIMARAARTGKTQFVADTSLDPDYVGRNGLVMRSELTVPVMVEGKVSYLLNIESEKPGALTEDDRNLVEILAMHAASNLERLRREEREREAQLRVIAERERAEQARRLEEIKTNFIRTATHEIRTPLTSIKGYAELAQALIDPEGSPTLASYFDTIMRNTVRLEKLTSDLLDVQRIESGRIELNEQPLQVRELLSEAAAELEPTLRRRSQRLTVSGDDAWVNADHTRLMQVLINLAVNASKFSPDDSEISISVEDMEEDVRISVADMGVGIRAEDVPKLFTPFPGIHVEGVSSGTGLGLSISRGIVELHGGRIWAESEGPGRGSTFTFTLPRSESGVDE